MKRSEYRFRDLWDEYVVLDAWDADAFAGETGLSPLGTAEARSRVASWARDPRIGRDLRHRVLGASARTLFYPGAAELEDAFRARWKIFKLPRAEWKGTKLGGAGAAAGASPAYVPPPPPPTAGEDKPKTWFEVKIVDVYGDPVSDAEVTFSQLGKQHKLKTNGAGVASWKDVEGPSFASAKLSRVKDLRESLKERWGKKEVKDGLEGDKLSIYDEELSSSLTSETPKVIVLYKPLTRIRLIGMHFDTNKCFLRETAMTGIRKVARLYKANPTGKLLITGHTDTVADDAYNLELSVERAEAVKAYLKDDVAAWEAWFADNKPKQKRWGNPEVMHMIAALPCEQTVAGFQDWSNSTKGTALKVDGIAGPMTRKALIQAYMGLDETTLPKSIEAVVHGCGEFFPMNNEADQGGKDGVAAGENRRVELFCFHDEITPPVPGPKASKGETEYGQWIKQVTTTLDVSTTSAGPANDLALASISFSGDHLDSEGRKLIRPGDLLYAEPTDTYDKPEWIQGRLASYPISQSVSTRLTLKVGLTGGPPGAKLTRLRAVPTSVGTANMDFATFNKTLDVELADDAIVIEDVGALIALPRTCLGTVGPFLLEWKAVIDGLEVPIGVSGPHTVYCTFDVPCGKMGRGADEVGTPGSGPAQSITESRLKLALRAFETEKPENEAAVVHAVSRLFHDRGIRYAVGRRYVNFPGRTYHQYLWQVLDHSIKAKVDPGYSIETVRGECDECAASMILACGMIGVSSPMEIGFMYPVARRDNSPPYAPRPGGQRGRLNVPDRRLHKYGGVVGIGETDDGIEELHYRDGSGYFNGYEGVAVYNGSLFAIGERVEPYASAHEFFTEDAAAFRFYWERLDAKGEESHCKDPYPGSAIGEFFRWED